MNNSNFHKVRKRFQRFYESILSATVDKAIQNDVKRHQK